MDAIVGSGCRPFVEIGLMPKALSTKPEPYKHEWPKSNLLGCSYPPKDYNKWAELIQKWVLHSKERYGEKINDWIWQLWNEPNISYWKGSFEEFCKLYDYTESIIHQVAPEIVFGGPHVANSGKRRYSDGFLRDFLTHCLKGTHAYTKEKGAQLDYIAFHSKGRVDLFENKPRLDLGRHLHHTQLQFDVISEFPELKKLPIIIGESDPEGAAALSARINPANAYRNGSAYAAYVAAMMKHIIDMAKNKQLNLLGVVTWAFMFDGKDYFEGFRTLTTNGIYKPVFNIFRLLNMLSGKRIPLYSSGALGTDQVIKNKVRQIPDIDGLAVTTDRVTQVLLWNYHDHVFPLGSALIQLNIKVPIINHRRARLTHYRIDDQHSNSYTKWLQLGSPQQLTSDKLDMLYQAAELDLLEPVSIHQVYEGKLQIEFELPHHAVSLIEFFWF
jgi:xylan 1,4-beta-xylosidase